MLMEDKFALIYPEAELDSKQQVRDLKLKAFFEKCMDQFGTTNPSCSSFWCKFMDYELMKNNLAMVNALGYMSLRLPIENSAVIKEK